LNAPNSAFVGDRPTLHAVLGNGSCASCDVRVESPDGKVILLKTDAKGNLVLPLDLKGIYKVTLLKDGVSVVVVTVTAAAAKAPAQNDLMAQVSATGGILLVLLLVFVVAVVLYRQYSSSKPGGKKWGGNKK
jgi:hypothetical protein